MPWIIAAALAAMAVLAAGLQLTGRRDQPREAAPESLRASVADSLAAELARCRALGEAALRDQVCLDAWTEHRRRFLRPGPSTDSTQ